MSDTEVTTAAQGRTVSTTWDQSDTDGPAPDRRRLVVVTTSGPPRGGGPGAGTTGRAHGEGRHLCPVPVVGSAMGAQIVTEWADTMRAAGLAARTVEERLIFLRSVERRTKMAAVALTTGAIRSFLGRDVSAGTRRRYWAYFMAWFIWLERAGYRSDNPLSPLIAPKEPKRNPRPLTTEQVSRMLDTRAHRRTHVMVLLGGYQGLRVSEIAKIRGEDLTDGELHVIGKGDVERWLPVDELVAAAATTMPRRGWWFPSHVKPDQPIAGQSVSEMLSHLMTRAGVPGTPHCLRHFYGTELLRSSGGNLELVRQLMGHADLSTTAIYTKVERDQMRAAVAGLPRPAASPLRAA